MRRYGGWCLALVLIAGSSASAKPQPRAVQEIWEAAYLEGGKAGYIHTTVREVARDGKKLFRTTMVLELSVKRFNDLSRLRQETGTDETADGKVVGVSMKQSLGKEQNLVMTGTVEGDELHVKVDGGQRLDKRKPWNDDVIGLYTELHIFQKRKVKPGDHFTYQKFEPQLTAVVTTRVRVKDYEDVAMPGTRNKERLLRVEASADKIDRFQPPPMTLWLNDKREPVLTQFTMDGLGKLVIQRTTEEVATGKKGAPPQITDIGFRQLIRLNRWLPRTYDTESAVYRITVKDDSDPSTVFAHDGRQEVKNVKGHTFELHVCGIREPEPVEKPGQAAAKFLKSNYFITSDDARVRQHARQAVGRETDAWQKARRIQRWVYAHMENKNYSEGFATADHVARTLEGDCTEHAVLAAAMCRAAGVPSRTAVGLVYAEMTRGPVRGPVMAFHMWTEVWVDGQWMPIDATHDKGYVGATHLKIADHSWYDTQTLAPLIPVLRVLGKTKIEVVRASGTE
ncbi:MAG TPA: transglutaminase domain-containing protein [Gemmataceae bacterium]|jgi:hypothetical protein|nr:transglutaminase domain-containing protein [Gemmataceae bacterium]